MLKVLSFLSKREGIETRAFISYYENYHVPLVLSLAWGPIVYKRNYLTRGDDLNREEDTIDFDVITELVFCDRADFLEWRGKLSVEAIGADEAKFLDRSPDTVVCHRGARDIERGNGTRRPNPGR
jgi:hypothetical protein